MKRKKLKGGRVIICPTPPPVAAPVPGTGGGATGITATFPGPQWYPIGRLAPFIRRAGELDEIEASHSVWLTALAPLPPIEHLPIPSPPHRTAPSTAPATEATPHLFISIGVEIARSAIAAPAMRRWCFPPDAPPTRPRSSPPQHRQRPRLLHPPSNPPLSLLKHPPMR